ncbi:MAG: hypothetical protein ACXU95_17610 [Isosphaeraceae bacterium]
MILHLIEPHASLLSFFLHEFHHLMSRRPPEVPHNLRRFFASKISPGGFASVRDEPCRSPRPSVSSLWFRRSRPSDSGRSWSASRPDGAGLERAEAPTGPDGEPPRSDGHQGEEAVVGIFPGQSSLERQQRDVGEHKDDHGPKGRSGGNRQ